MPTASLHLEQGTAIVLSSLTPSPELSPPSQALLLDAALQRLAFKLLECPQQFICCSRRPFLLPTPLYCPKFTNILRVSQSVYDFCNFSGLSQLCLLGWGWEGAQMPKEPWSPWPNHNSCQSRLEGHGYMSKKTESVVPDLFSAHLSQSRCVELVRVMVQVVLAPHLLWGSTHSWDGSEARGLIWHKAWLFRANPSEFLK